MDAAAPVIKPLFAHDDAFKLNDSSGEVPIDFPSGKISPPAGWHESVLAERSAPGRESSGHGGKFGDFSVRIPLNSVQGKGAKYADP